MRSSRALPLRIALPFRLRTCRTASASITVDVPVPFSPTKNVTGEVNRRFKERMGARLNGYSSDWISPGFTLAARR